MTQRAVILAAGKGERLVKGVPYPKPMKPILGIPLVGRILRSLAAGGVREVAVVTGHLGETLRDYLRNEDFGCVLHYFENDEIDKPNGTSLLKAKAFVTEPTLLLMSDHLWSQGLLRAVRESTLPLDDLVLGIDYNIDACVDLDDATKVCLDGNRIVEIGKTLPKYNALDTGVFRIGPSLIDALQALDEAEGCSLSQGVAALAAEGRAWGADVGVATWVDVDTPLAYAHAEKKLRELGDALESGASERA